MVRDLTIRGSGFKTSASDLDGDEAASFSKGTVSPQSCQILDISKLTPEN